jgi:RimJ/RimL family protein N-acetyltransferase
VLVSDDDRWHGLALVRFDDETPGAAVVNAMWVGPSARGQRGARALCDACADWAAGRGCSELRLTVVVDNDAARRAYEAAGFAVCGRTTWPRDGELLDEFVMSRPLRPPARE